MAWNWLKLGTNQLLYYTIVRSSPRCCNHTVKKPLTSYHRYLLNLGYPSLLQKKTLNLEKNKFLGKSNQIKQNMTRPKKFEIRFCVILGHWTLPQNFGIFPTFFHFLISFCRSRLTTHERTRSQSFFYWIYSFLLLVTIKKQSFNDVLQSRCF